MTDSTAAADVELAIGGMTCASCAARIEKKLNRLDGVTATVNYATEKARVTLRRRRDHRRPDRHRRDTGYTAALPAQPGRRPATRRRASPTRVASLRHGCWSRAALTVPVVALAMVPALQFDYWQWLSLTLATPVVDLGRLAVPPGRLDQPAARRGRRWTPWSRSASLAAFGWSLYALFLGDAGDARHDAPVRADARPRRRRRQDLPRGRRRRHRCSCWPAATSRPGPSARPAPRCARCWSSAPRTSPCCATAPRSAVPVDRAAGRRRSSWSGPGRRSPPTAWSSRAPRRSTPRCSPASRCRSRSGPATRSSGATVNAGGRLVVRATRVGADTQLAQMARLVEDAQNGKAECSGWPTGSPGCSCRS